MDLRLRSEHLQQLKSIGKEILHQKARVENSIAKAFQLDVNDVFDSTFLDVIAC